MDDEKLVRRLPMPESDKVLAGVIKWLREKAPEQMFVVMEQQTPRPTTYYDRSSGGMKSTILKSTCLLYGSYMRMRGTLAGMGLDYLEVSPKAWQKALGVPEKGKLSQAQWKAKLKGVAEALFPEEKITLATADAFLLAEFLRRTKNSNYENRRTMGGNPPEDRRATKRSGTD